MIARPFLLTSLLFAAAFAQPGAALAKDGPPGPDGLPIADKKHPWNFFVGEAYVDTISFPLRDVAAGAPRQFTVDHWIMFRESLKGDVEGVVVTKWKQMHHPLIWLFMGKTLARCTVELSAAGPGRTRVSFRAELASHRKLEGNPMLPAAKKAYAKAARVYKRDMTRDLIARQRSHEPPVAQRLEPGVRRQEPAVRRQEPAVKRQNPEVTHQDAAVRRQDPATGRQDPSAR